MKVESDGGTVVEVDSDELEAVSQTVDGIVALADTVFDRSGGGHSESDSDSAFAGNRADVPTGTCEACGSADRVLRDVAGSDDTGGIVRRSVCRECQEQMIADAVANDAGGGAGGRAPAPEDVPSNLDYSRLPEDVNGPADVLEFLDQTGGSIGDLPTLGE